MDTSTKHVPHLCPSYIEDSKKDCKRQRIRNFAVRLCLLVTTEDIPIIFHQRVSSNVTRTMRTTLNVKRH